MARKTLLLLSLAMLFLAGTAMALQQAELVKDINIRPAGLYPTILGTAGGRAYYYGYDAKTGWEPHQTNGTTVGTGLIKDINHGVLFSAGAGNDIEQKNNTLPFSTFLLFPATDPQRGRELWRTDGTAAGTGILKDINPGQGDTLFGSASAVVGPYGFFEVRAPEESRGLWYTNGSTAGTQRLWTGFDTVEEMHGLDQDLYFIITTPSGYMLVKLNMTTGFSLAVPGQVYPGNVIEAGSALYARAWDQDLGNDTIYKITSAGVSPLSSVDAYGAEIFGGAAGLFYYTSIDVQTFNRDIYSSDGTQAGTVKIGTLGHFMESTRIIRFQRLGALSAFITEGTGAVGVAYDLWITDGTPAGTQKIKTLSSGFLYNSFDVAAAAGGKLYFANDDGMGSGLELWVSDGTAAGTGMVRELNPGMANGISDYSPIGVLGNYALFAGITPIEGNQLWMTDGTAAGTTMLSSPSGGTDLLTITETGSPTNHDTAAFGHTVELNGRSYFVCYGNADNGETRVCYTDATTGGTGYLWDETDEIALRSVGNLTASGDKLYFTGTNLQGGMEQLLWVLDSGATLPNQIASFQLPYYSDEGSISSLTDLNGVVYFAAYDPAYGTELWRSDGTAAGTFLVTDIESGTDGFGSPVGSYPTGLVAFDGVLYFNATTADFGSELWRSDGSVIGTYMVEDINPGAESSFPSHPALFNGRLYFVATTPAWGSELWKTDGNLISMVADINPLSESSSPSGFAIAGPNLYFTATTATSGRELWKTDGTAAGTTLVKDIYPPTTAEYIPSGLTGCDGRLYFLDSDNVKGIEVWTSDGTSVGTAILKDIVAGPLTSEPFGLTCIDRVLYFGADDGTGVKLWSNTDGTGAGTVPYAEIVGGAYAGGPRKVGGRIVFNGAEAAYGQELYGAAVENVLPVLTVPGPVTVIVGDDVTFRVRVRDIDGDPLTMNADPMPVGAMLTVIPEESVTNDGSSLLTMEFSWTTSTPGIVTVTFTVFDGVASVEKSVVITVGSGINHAPTISGSPGTSVIEDSAYTFQPTGGDIDGDKLTYSILNRPTWASFSTSTGELSGTPGNGDIGLSEGITIKVTDTSGATAELPAFAIAVLGVNDAPAITGQKPLITVQSVPVTLSLDSLLVNDPDSGYPGGFSLLADVGADYSLSAVGSGSVTVTPAKDYIGTLSIPVRVNDGQLDSARRNIEITVNDNPAPAAPNVSVQNYTLTPVWTWSGDSQSGTGIYRTKLDGGSFGSDTSATVYTPANSLGAGPHTLEVQEKNANGEWSLSGSATSTIDTIAPSAAISEPNGTTPANKLAKISGSASDDGQIALVEIQISKGGFYASAQYQWTTTPTWIAASGTANWELDTGVLALVSQNTYTIKARAIDRAGNKSPEAQTSYTYDIREGNQAYTTLSIELSSQSILEGSTIDLGGRLTRLPSDTSKNLSGLPITISVTDPDGIVATSQGTTNSALGHYTISDISGFGKRGLYGIKAKFGGTSELSPCESGSQNILVGSSAGYAIIVEGRTNTGEGLASHNKTANRIYKKLKSRGLPDSDILYLNHETDQLGITVDGTPTIDALKSAIETWAHGKIVQNRAPLHIILIDHGKRGGFFLDPGILTPETLAGSISALEGKLGENRPPLTLIIGACYSGSFIPAISRPGRIIITSAAADEESYRGPNEPDNIRSGEYFLEELGGLLGRGKNIRDAFIGATEKTETYTRKGEGKSDRNQYQDDAMQHPLLDDNGDGKGSNIIGLGSADGSLAATLYLGTGGKTQSGAGQAPQAETTGVTPTLTLTADQTSASIWLSANDNSLVSAAWAETRSPSYKLAGSGGTTQLSVTLPKNLLSLNETSGRWETDLSGITEPGRHEIYYILRDLQSGNLSQMKRSIIYKNKSGNHAPTQPGLLLPEEGATVETTTILKWNPSTDQDGDQLTYTLEISESADFSSIAHKAEEIKAPFYVIDTSANLKDLTTYQWRITAVDPYGIANTSQSGTFKTENKNAVLSGLLSGVVYDISSGAPLTKAQITSSDSSGTSGGGTSIGGGYYLSNILTSNTTLLISAEGYKTVQLEGLSANPGELLELNIALEPEQGLDTIAPSASADKTSGRHSAPLTVTLSCTDNESGTGCESILYTTNGSEPTADSTPYSGALTISQTTTLKYIAKDKAGNTSEAKTLELAINQAPAISPVPYRNAVEGTKITIGITATDAESDTVQLSALNLPTGATFINNTLEWTPATGQAGTHEITISATDGMDQSTAKVTIEVAQFVVPATPPPATKSSGGGGGGGCFIDTAGREDQVLPALAALLVVAWLWAIRRTRRNAKTR